MSFTDFIAAYFVLLLVVGAFIFGAGLVTGRASLLPLLRLHQRNAEQLEEAVSYWHKRCARLESELEEDSRV